MKIHAINGSPRKTWNSATILEHFTRGVHSAQEDAEIEIINLYDYIYTGCKSCFACKLKNGKLLECAVRDDIHDILQEAFTSDGIIFSSPIYFQDVSAQMRGFLERLMYPGISPKTIPTAFIYTMNATEQQMKNSYIPASLATLKMYLESTFHSETEQIFAYNTLQKKNYDDYRATRQSVAEKKILHETQFPIDCQNAFEAGKRMVEKIRAIVK